MTRLVLVLAVLSSPTVALAQTTPLTPAAPIVASPGTDNAENAPDRTTGVAFTLSAGARVGYFEHHGAESLIGPLGGIDLMIGHQLALLDGVEHGSVSLVYHGSVYGGPETPAARALQIEHRHAVGLQLRVNDFMPTLSTGVIVAHFPRSGAVLPGWHLTTTLGYCGGAFVFSVPISLDVYVGPGGTLVAGSFGVALGGTTN